MPKKVVKKFHLVGSLVSLLFIYLLQVKIKAMLVALVVIEIAVVALCRQFGLAVVAEARTEISPEVAADLVASEAEALEAAVPAEVGKSYKPGKPYNVPADLVKAINPYNALAEVIKTPNQKDVKDQKYRHKKTQQLLGFLF